MDGLVIRWMNNPSVKTNNYLSRTGRTQLIDIDKF